MKSFIAAAGLFALASTSPVPQTTATTTTNPLRFSGLSLRSASPIHLSSINANGNAFWIGKNTTTYCPTDSAASEACTTAITNQTIFSQASNQTTLSLATIVPGGQQVYVTAGDEETGQLAGQLKFTTAHSAATSGPAVYEGFSVVENGTTLQFEGMDWWACPVDAFNSGYGIWAVSRVEGSNAGAECLSFTWRVVNVGEEVGSAWQYE